MLKEFVGSTNGDHSTFLHEFFFTANAETNKTAIKLFIQKNFHVQVWVGGGWGVLKFEFLKTVRTF